jgi:NAD(P) transhydrogenase subunit beta
MTDMPELVAVFNGLGGAASTFVALSYCVLEGPLTLDTPTIVSVMLSLLIGTVTLTGSLVAYGKLSGKLPGGSILLPARHVINLALFVGIGMLGWWIAGSDSTGAALTALALATLLSAALGILLVIPIGGADMPVVISLLNSYSGLAAAMTGFVLIQTGNDGANMLIISGALVGAAGLILTNIMCKAMNRSLLNVLTGGFGETAGASTGGGGNDEYVGVTSTSAEEAAMLLDGAELVIIVPGYGLAVAQAQHVLAELDELLTENGTEVRYAIHPVAGRMPGHMNVLLAEASVAYEKLYDLDEINGEFKNAQVSIVVGANDVVNPVANTDPESPIAGMPVLNVNESQSVIVIKRSLSAGYAGIKNPLFEADNANMLFADAKVAIQDMVKEVKDF